MHVLVLRPEMNTLYLNVYENQKRSELLKTELVDYTDYLEQPGELSGWIARQIPGRSIDVICIRCLFGGLMEGPEWVTEKTVKQLEQLVAYSPVHLPRVLELIRVLQQTFMPIPIVLLFETAFFKTLPEREKIYAIEYAQAKELGIERRGFHGLFHMAACGMTLHSREQCPVRTSSRIISICLEPISEIAAFFGNRALITSSGGTVLEGLIGEKSCGQIDPGIILDIAREMKWGPEEISQVLTQKSGILALVGKAVTLRDIFLKKSNACKRARDVFQYQVIQHCGAAIAVMGGCDKIVFSGKYAALGEILGPWLLENCHPVMRYQLRPITYEILYEPIDRICADMAFSSFLSQKKFKAS